MSTSSPLSSAHAAIDEVRAWALAQFGWTHVRLQVDGDDGHLRVHGEVVAPRLLSRIRRSLAAAVPGATIDLRGVGWLAGDGFHPVPGDVVPLWRRPDRDDPRERVTELVPADGPLERLAVLDDATLVRVPDGTLGWLQGLPLGPRVPAPCFASPPSWHDGAVAAAVHLHLGAPYRIGGGTPNGIDCSALVQRLLSAIGWRVPRHSADQLAIGPHDGLGPDRAGTLVAQWSELEAPCHVGLALGDGTIVHASRSRREVVIDARDRWCGAAVRLAHVEREAIEALQRRAIGHRNLLEVLALGELEP